MIKVIIYTDRISAETHIVTVWSGTVPVTIVPVFLVKSQLGGTSEVNNIRSQLFRCY